MLSKTVADYLRANRARHVASLKELLSIPSIANVTGEKVDSCRTAAQWLARHLSALGLSAEVVPAGGKPNVLAEGRAGDGLPTLLIYGHYDVQPPDPLELWASKPFEPAQRDGFLYARGASDNKGQIFAHLTALEAWVRAGGGLPVNVKVIIEGEEEIGSPNLDPFIRQHADRLRSDAIIISDSGFFAEGVPSITYSLRGLAYFEITLTGPAADLHSGSHGGAVVNPINALARLIAGMQDADGRVTLPGFYDDVLPLTDQERSAWADLPFDESAYARELGVDKAAGGETGYSILERRWARPTLDANGIVGGYIEPGAKTVIPARASAKVSCRLVPNQDPEKITAGMRQYLDANVPAGTRVELAVHATARPVMVSQDAPAMNAAKAALAEAFGAEPVMVRCGASVPITELFQRILGRDGVLMGFGLPADSIHSPNERFKLEQFYRGAVAAAALLQNVRDAGL
ncbi:MAG TPA: dipeptidase [Phycisphaerae bacterium]|nr:dipeptidase [Phycisphaerae bacterium]